MGLKVTSIKQEPFAFLDNQLQEFSSETQKLAQQDRDAGYIIPKRRVCEFGQLASGLHRWQAEHTDFISPSERFGAPYAMRFLTTPFSITSESEIEEYRELEKTKPKFFLGAVKELLEQNEKAKNAIGVTKDGRHVILQQAVASCVPTSVAMIVLDHGGKPNYESITGTHFADDDDAVNWIKEAGFSAKLTLLPVTDKIRTLSKCLKENGPGVLSISGKDIGGHDIVLDAIEDEIATIRDPFHGWCIDIRLDVLNEIAGRSFIQITGKKTS
jgi:Papain-like cysteine protease AvrRpt2